MLREKKRPKPKINVLPPIFFFNLLLKLVFHPVKWVSDSNTAVCVTLKMEVTKERPDTKPLGVSIKEH